MYWNILIIVNEEDYEKVREYFKKYIPYKTGQGLPFMRSMKDECQIFSGLLNIDIFPWRGRYHWRGYKPQLVYIPK